MEEGLYLFLTSLLAAFKLRSVILPQFAFLFSEKEHNMCLLVKQKVLNSISRFQLTFPPVVPLRFELS